MDWFWKIQAPRGTPFWGHSREASHLYPLSTVRQNRIQLDYIVYSHSSVPAPASAQFDPGLILTGNGQQWGREIYGQLRHKNGLIFSL